jgi:tetratricopeptide (TPR) repeat protein
MMTVSLHRLRVIRLVFSVSALSLISACGRQEGPMSTDVVRQPLEAFREEASMGRWDEAWAYSNSVESQHGKDAEVLADLARVAYASKHPDDATRLLMAACRAENFEDEKRVGQAVVAATSIGKLFDAMDFLAEVVEAQPDQLDSRRLLFDLLIGVEDRIQALPHGRHLVNKRRFDFELLTAISNTEKRTIDAVPLLEMVKRNPSDKRPLIGEAKTAYDRGAFEEAIKVTKEILRTHPDDIRSAMLLGQALVSLGRYDELYPWAKSLRGAYQDHPSYWTIIGDWSTQREQNQEAARAYWEATKRDVDALANWVRFRKLIQQLPDSFTVPAATIVSVDQRIDQLSRFYQAKEQFTKTGNRSRRLVLEIAAALEPLGRLWEAEAWLALSLTLPEDATAAVSEKRSTIVAQLSKKTPWQVVDGHPELQLDLASLRLPELENKGKAPAFASSRQNQPTGPAATTTFRLQNEAHERGLRFHGKTGDRVAGPGVPFYQTLGCGGGAIDYDLDGWVDIYLCAAGGTPPNSDSEPNCLMRNLNGKFTDVTNPTGTGDRGFGQGVAVGDLNEDGLADILVLNYGTNCVLINQGDGTFVNRTNQWLPDAIPAWASSGAIADVNSDGIADAIIVNYCAGLEPITKVCGDPKDAPGGIPRACSPLTFAGEQDLFLEGSPSGELRDRTTACGAVPNVVGRGLGITVGTFDAMPGLDVFIANDMTNNHFWSRGQSDSFSLIESSIPRGLAGDARSLPQGSMGIATADMDRDGDTDFYVTNFSSEYNSYHVQESPGIWRDQTTLANLSLPTLPMVGFGTQALDIDNDGTLELVVSNGHVDSYDDISKKSPYAQPMQVFRSVAKNQFESVGELIPSEYFQQSHVGRALWTVDVDRDGRLDLVVTHQTESVALLMNNTPPEGAFLNLRLVGVKSSRDAIGAVVKVKATDQFWTATLTSGSGYLSSNDRALCFGLGKGIEKVDVEVTWPSGTQEHFNGLDCNSSWLLIECRSPYDLEVASPASLGIAQPHQVQVD